MNNCLEKAYEIAKHESVATEPDYAVVYSVSYMPNSKNKEAAKAFIQTHEKAKMLDDTPCGQALIGLGLDGRVDEVGEEITKIWRIASSRYIKEAKGNINAFVEGADERSTFCTTELEEIMENPQITSINGMDKKVFVQNFHPKFYE